MTDREKAIIMAYTGVAMLTGDKLDIFYKYLAELFGRPVFTHELATDEMEKAIKEKSYADFIKVCRETVELIAHAHWIESEEGYLSCSNCHNAMIELYENSQALTPFCPYCGAVMDGESV